MTELPLPYLLVVNSTTDHHHLPQDEPHRLTPEAVHLFLESVRNQSAPVKIFNVFSHLSYLIVLHNYIYHTKQKNIVYIISGF